jgi:magnesium-protoporphyrin O-methyltransferase
MAQDRESACCIARNFDRQVREATEGDILPDPSPASLRLLEMLDDVAVVRPTLLDLGCGTAPSSVRLVENGARRVTGIDLSPVSINTARRRAAAAGLDETRANFSIGDAAFAPLQRHDWVLLDRVICCYSDPRALLGNAIPATRSRIAIIVPESRGWRGVINAVTWGAENLWKSIAWRETCAGHVHDVSAIELSLETAGFKLIDKRRHALWYAAVYQRLN